MHRMWKYKMGHIIFWVATILFHMYTRSNLLESAGIKHFIVEIIIRNGLLALLIYFNLQVLIPHYVRTQRWISYALLLAISLFGYALLKNLHDVYLFGSVLNEVSQMEYFHNTFYNISITLFYVAFSIALELSREWYLQREFIQRIEMEKLNTELEYLKAQINPHFLFNSINTIYFQIDKQNKVARDMVSSFSDMLRYQLYECSGNDIDIEREVNYLRHYVDLQRKRMDDNYKILFNANEDVTGFSIAPLLLIPFVENAFKHVSHFPFDNEISISLSASHDMFIMNVINTKDHETEKIDNGGIGLTNVKRRLQLIYNSRHTLDIHERPGSFEINLSLKVDRI